MRVWETVEVIADSNVGKAIGVAGDIDFSTRVLKWSVSAAMAAASYAYKKMSSDENENSKGSVICGICGQSGHNRRTCEYNEECGNCGNKEASEIWDLDGNYCCDKCVDDVDI